MTTGPGWPDIATANAYAGPNHLTANLVTGAWSVPLPAPARQPDVNFLNSSQQALHEDLQYNKADLLAVEEWVKRHTETTWHSLGELLSPPQPLPR